MPAPRRLPSKRLILARTCRLFGFCFLHSCVIVWAICSEHRMLSDEVCIVIPHHTLFMRRIYPRRAACRSRLPLLPAQARSHRAFHLIFFSQLFSPCLSPSSLLYNQRCLFFFIHSFSLTFHTGAPFESSLLILLQHSSPPLQTTPTHTSSSLPSLLPPCHHCAFLPFTFSSNPPHVSSSQYRHDAARMSRNTKRSSAFRGAYTRHIPTGAMPNTACGGPRSPHPFFKTSHASTGANRTC